MPDVAVVSSMPRSRPGRRRRSSRLLRAALLLLVSLSVVLVGCPRRFDASATPSVESANAEATHAFRQAKKRFDTRPDDPATAKAFESFVSRFASDPLAPLARIYLGRLALRHGRIPAARRQLEPVSRAGANTAAVSRLARYYLGLAAARAGTHAEARKLLRPFVEAADEPTRAAVLVALAAAEEGLGNLRRAAEHLDRLHRESTRESERLYARHRLAQLVERLRPTTLRTLTGPGASTEGLLFALASRRQLSERIAPEAAEQLRARSANARAAHGVDLPAAGAALGGPIGLLLPFEGRYRSVGRLALAGAVFGSAAFVAKGNAKRPTLLVRDSSRQAAHAARELIKRGNAVALIGVFDPARASAVARVALEHRVPFISLCSAAPAAASNTTFRLLPTGKQRATALARRVLPPAGGGARLAILAPDNGYGRGMARAFATEAARRGGRVVTERFYPTGLASFTAQAKELARINFDVLFIPDSARRLALIAPALALAGLWSATPGQRPAKGRPLRLAATADGLSRALLDRAGRYVQGALLAPGYFADQTSTGDDVARYQRVNKRVPSLVEAFAADAVATVQRHVERGARSRAALLAALRSGSVTGLTGKLRFAADGTRADPPRVYRVIGQRIAPLPSPKKR